MGGDIFLCCFSLKLVEMNELRVGGILFGMVIWVHCFILLEQGFFDKMAVLLKSLWWRLWMWCKWDLVFWGI